MTAEEFQKLHHQVVKCMESNDFMKMLDYVTENYVHHIPFMKKRNHVQHKDNDFLRHRMLNDEAQIHCKVVALDIFDDVAIDRGTFAKKLPSGEKTGNYLCVWKKEEGKWKIFDICISHN